MHRLSTLSIAGLLLISGCGSKPATETATKAEPAAPVRILQFYAAPGVVAAGETVSICYGVEGADTVRLDPAVEDVKPSLSRCVSVKPTADTEYTLIAEGGGTRTEQKTSVKVSGKAASAPATPAVAEDAGPRVNSFTAKPTEVASGESVMLCFDAVGDKVILQPGAKEFGQARIGCYAVSPTTTTEYGLIAERGGKRDVKSLTVKVR